MTDPALPSDAEPGDAGSVGPNTLRPLPGEPGIPSVAARTRQPMSRKGLLALGLLVVSVVAVSAFSLHRMANSGRKADDGDPKRQGDRPAAATTEVRKLDLPSRAAVASHTASVVVTPASAPRIPALVPTAEELEPIGVRRTGQTGPSQGNAKAMNPEDAPVMLVSSRPTGVNLAAAASSQRAALAAPNAAHESGTADDRTDVKDPLAATERNLEVYQRQLQGLLDTLTPKTARASGDEAAPPGGAPAQAIPPGTGFAESEANRTTPSGSDHSGGQVRRSATPRVVASMLGNRSLTLAKGTAFTCALKTKIISAASGMVGCQVQRNIYSDDGRVLLIERGSHLDGEYHITSVRPGTVRIPVLWTRIRTPNGVTVDIDSPGTGQLGESGIDGYVDNRWGERIGAAMLLSLIDDSVKMIIQNQAGSRQGDTIVLSSTTTTTSNLAEKVLDSTINIPPLIYHNQGGIVGIYVARDVDFSSVYELRPIAPDAASAAQPARVH